VSFTTVSAGRQVGDLALPTALVAAPTHLPSATLEPRYRVISHDVHQVVVLRAPPGPSETSRLWVMSGPQVLELATSQPFSNR